MTTKTGGRRKVLDLRALGSGALVALGATAAGLAGSIGHHLLLADVGGTQQGIEAVFAEGLIFLGVLGVGVPVATFVSVWRGRALALTQGAVAIALDWAVGFGLGGLVLSLLPGGSTEIFGLFVMLSPVFAGAQAVAALTAWLVRRVRGRAGHAE